MKKIATLLFCSALLLTACGKKHSISGNLSGLTTDTLIINFVGFGDARKVDTIIARNGQFTYDWQDTALTNVLLYPKQGGKGVPAENIQFLIVPGEQAIISGTMADYKIDGSKFLQEYAEALSVADDFQQKVKALGKKYTDLMKSGKISGDSVNILYFAELEPLENEYSEKVIAYIKANPDKEASAILVGAVNEHKAKETLALMSDRIKNGRMSPLIKQTMARVEHRLQMEKSKLAIQPGNPAPDFTLKDMQGKDLSLSSLRGKYVVLDFWGSWCHWCIKGFPEMKKSYAKHSKKIEFLGIDCDDTDPKWRKAVKDNQLPWLQVRDAKDDGIDVPALYAVTGYPTKIVIDPEGKILKIIVGEDPEFYTYLDTL